MPHGTRPLAALALLAGLAACAPPHGTHSLILAARCARSVETGRVFTHGAGCGPEPSTSISPAGRYCQPPPRTTSV
jgi:hypothetical protein